MDKKNRIKLLPDSTIKKIAAGEVVERPASVVKEIIENSIDADADEIKIEVIEGGIRQIKISDNGIGMSEEDANESYKLHTTSKIKSIDDLNNINSFGFRGEALASISAISQTVIHSYENKSKPIKLVIEEGRIIESTPSPRTVGTTITVTDIFRHLPARKKFLRSAQTEYRNILIEIIKVAIREPQIKFEVWHNQKLTLTLAKTNDYKQRILDIYPNLQSQDLIDVFLESPLVNISGYVIHPNKLSADRTKQFLFINNRFVLEKSISKAIRDGYFSMIPKENNPGYFLNYEIDPEHLDINIHPRKLEVKIDRIGEIFSMTRRTIESALKKKVQNDLAQKFGTNFQAYEKQKDTGNFFSPEQAQNSQIKSTIIPLKETFNFGKPTKNLIKKSLAFTERILNPTPDLFKYTQLFKTYILLEKEDEVLIIDQHAADERINFEKIYAKIENEKMLEKKDLLIPINLDFSDEEIELVKENTLLFSSLGLDIDIFGKNTIKINTIPEFSRDIDFLAFLKEIIETLRNKSDDSAKDTKHKIASSLACHGSIRAGKELTGIEVEKLVSDLFKCEKPYSCPHGRPIIWTLTKKELEKKFNRCK